jgi:hypothetical protein
MLTLFFVLKLSQIIHKEAYVGQSKVKSAADACRE